MPVTRRRPARFSDRINKMEKINEIGFFKKVDRYVDLCKNKMFLLTRMGRFGIKYWAKGSLAVGGGFCDVCGAYLDKLWIKHGLRGRTL
jgi:hypothetical protein